MRRYGLIKVEYEITLESMQYRHYLQDNGTHTHKQITKYAYALLALLHKLDVGVL